MFHATAAGDLGLATRKAGLFLVPLQQRDVDVGFEIAGDVVCLRSEQSRSRPNDCFFAACLDIPLSNMAIAPQDPNLVGSVLPAHGIVRRSLNGEFLAGTRNVQAGRFGLHGEARRIVAANGCQPPTAENQRQSQLATPPGLMVRDRGTRSARRFSVDSQRLFKISLGASSCNSYSTDSRRNQIRDFLFPWDDFSTRIYRSPPGKGLRL